ncbi:ATP-binding cassette domain-containing protein [Sphingobacterium olei]|uniref:ATP-binding cassette domain-containing protein n=1 Tax=Sphingobacterium olei TaxID=2571155 RepID=A0A4U0NGM0_9SPHI|nr:AAA family ATPase [Sphingobacterium olei]TJZ53315.1 ATP-binding cassette domain-containing protein [Sphingobacterium olei]
MIYISQIRNNRPTAERNSYPYNIPSIAKLDELSLRNPVTFIIGENGSGKSTLVESIAINAGFNAEGGSRNFNFSTQDSHSVLFEDIQLIRTGYRNKDGYFLRAESFYNVATAVDNYSAQDSYGGSLHERSHGESFLALLHNRLYGNGLYIFDEPESALSVVSQMNMLTRIRELVNARSQFIIATHSPILLAYPDADIYQVTEDGLQHVLYEDTEQYRLTK